MSTTLRSALNIAVAMLVSLLGVVPVTGADRPVQRQTKERGKAESYAFLVAVQDYDSEQFRPLEYTKNDVEALHKILLQSGFPKDNMVLMHDGRPRRFRPEAAKIRSEFRALLARVETGDTLVVALSGHGVQFKAKEKGKEETPYFCPADAKLAGRRNLIGLDELYARLKECPADRKLLLVDACRNDPLTKGDKGLPEVSLDTLRATKKMPLPKGLVAFFSCGVGEKSYEEGDLKHGVFFYHLLKGWQGEAANEDGEVTLERLVAYTRKQTKKYIHLKRGAIQRPFLRSELEDDWVLRKLDLGHHDLELGMAAYRKKEYDLALTHFDNAIRANPKLAKAYVERGLLYSHQKKDPNRAIADFDQSIRLDPRNAKAYNGRGWVYYYPKSEYDRAIADFTQAIHLEPRAYNHYHARGLAYQSNKDYDKAIADFTEAIPLNGQQARQRRGFVYYLYKEDYDRAIADYTEVIRIDPNNAYAYHWRGHAHRKKKAYDRAIADYTQAIRLKPKDYGYYHDRAEVYQDKNDHARAIADYTQAINVKPKHGYCYSRRGRAYEAMKDYDRAIADFDEAIRLEPKDSYYHQSRARNYEGKASYYQVKADRYKEARSSRGKALRKKFLRRAKEARGKARLDLEKAKNLSKAK